MANTVTSPKSTANYRAYDKAGQSGLLSDKQYPAADILDDIQAELGVPLEVDDTNGAISIKAGKVMLIKAGVAAMTLAAPVAGTDDGKVLKFSTSTANAHTVTFPSGKINGGANTVATWTAAIGNGMEIIAYQGVWYTISTKGVTIS
jgi:hypothetical protein